MTFEELESMSKPTEKEEIKPAYNSYENYNNNNRNNNNYNNGYKQPYKPAGKKENTINMYEVDIIPSKKIDTDSFEKVGRSFAIHTFKADDDAKKKIMLFANMLVEQGFVFRHNGNEEDDLQNEILGIKDIKVEYYLPYVKFNTKVQKAVLVNYYELPFNYAAEVYGKRFNDLKKGARSIYASKVQTLLGKECNNPVDFLICYSPDGAERHPVMEKGKKINFENLGTLGFYLKVTDTAGIATYNLKKEDSIMTLLKLLK